MRAVAARLRRACGRRHRAVSRARQPELARAAERRRCSASCSSDAPSLATKPVAFDDPLYILYSSGTTGVPKCIVHGVGGTLIQHRKEHVLHTDIRPGDVGVLLHHLRLDDVELARVGARLAARRSCSTTARRLHPDPGILWRLAERERVAIFGTSAKYLSALEKSGFEPREHARAAGAARDSIDGLAARARELRLRVRAASKPTCSSRRSPAART